MGQNNGSISIVGISYSHAEMPEINRERIAAADLVIGDVVFLKQIDALIRTDAVRTDPTEDITAEVDFREARSRRVVDAAREGYRVVMVSSGDPGIWGMASYVLNFLQDHTDAYGDPHETAVEILPAPTAFQIAAARIGTPLQDGFITCSLCDDLTPAETVHDRLVLAARSGMATVVYKPRFNSELFPERYPEQRFPRCNPPRTSSNAELEHLADVMLEQRGGSTPVVVAEHLGEKQEQVSVWTLDEFRGRVDDVSYFAVVIVCSDNAVRVGPYISVRR